MIIRPWQEINADDWVRHSLRAWSYRSEFLMAIVDGKSSLLGGYALDAAGNSAHRRSLSCVEDNVYVNVLLLKSVLRRWLPLVHKLHRSFIRQ